MQAWAEWFYNSGDWRQLREDYLTSQQNICERCGEPAKIAHHKTWLTPANITDPSVSLNPENLEALCQDCHNKEHHKTKQTRYTFDAEGNLTPAR